jgi:hypothetical protein
MTFKSCRVSRAVALLLVLIAGSPGLAYSADAALTRVLMLPLVDRTTVVAELTGRVPRVREVDSNPATVTIEAGPVDAATRPLDLTPIARSRFVAHVSVRTATGPDGLSYMRMQITLAAFCAHHLRISGSRVYVDLVPLDERAPSPLVPLVSAEKASRDSAYRDLESSVLPRARELASRPDVTALLRLHDEILSRDDRLGRRRPEVVERLLMEVLKYTNDARAAQLKKDREALLKAR